MLLVIGDSREVPNMKLYTCYKQVYMYIWYYMVQSCYPSPPLDGDGLRDDVYGGAVTQGKMIPRPPLWVVEGGWCILYV